MSLFPREHGASMELAFPLLSAFALGSPTPAAFGLAAAAVLVFVSHEALLVSLGQRGARQRAESSPAARRTLAVLLALALIVGVPALVSLAPGARLAVLVPVTLATVALTFVVRGERERTLPVEIFVAVTLATVAFPAAVEAGLPALRATTLVLVWSLAFTQGTVAARGVLHRRRDSGRGLVATRRLAVVLLGGSTSAEVLGLVPHALALALMPWALGALLVSWRPPEPRQMTSLGVGLTVASSMTLAILVALPW